MYNFIFWFFYKFFEWKEKSRSTLIPAMIVVIAFMFHLGLVYSLFRYITHQNPLEWGGDLSYSDRKYLGMPFVLVIYLLIWHFYYRKRAARIMNSYEGKKPFTVRNIIFVLLITVVPLIIAIRLVNLSVRTGAGIR